MRRKLFYSKTYIVLVILLCFVDIIYALIFVKSSKKKRPKSGCGSTQLIHFLPLLRSPASSHHFDPFLSLPNLPILPPLFYMFQENILVNRYIILWQCSNCSYPRKRVSFWIDFKGLPSFDRSCRKREG